ncbi:hypothetical protein ACLOAU_17350 [Niabella sp. CJ426]|uniref:hypothetical protein n=1 Tax=Niabella sp. CJ426 TaxID=3393740 RepID=UPI003D0743BD
MKKVQLISKTLFYITRLLGVLYFSMPLYSLVCLATGWSTEPYGNGAYMHIHYPFTQVPFLNIDNNIPYIIFEFLLPLGLYGFFFWLTGNVFKAFYQPRLFTNFGVKQLRNFYLANLAIPLPALLLSSVFAETDSIAFALVVVHSILGIFAYFMAVIFMQGVKLQNEQELFI